MALEVITEHFQNDITITRARYAELIRAENDAIRLKNLIYDKCFTYSGISHEEVKLINQIFSTIESEGK